MSGALIILAANRDTLPWLQGRPQISYFKIIYRRYVKFTSEAIKQTFQGSVPTFGQKTTMTIAKAGDFLGTSYVVCQLPKIKQFTDPYVKFAWHDYLGFRLVKSYEIEFNGKLIDRHYGEYLFIYMNMTNILSNYARMIGHLPELTNFTSSKEAYTIYIPILFWYCLDPGSAIPLSAMPYVDIKFSLELEDLDKCCKYGPDYYIACYDDVTGFYEYEYLIQNIDGNIRAGIFMGYNSYEKRLYYYALTDNKFVGCPGSKNLTTEQITLLLASPEGIKYQIVGQSSHYSLFGLINTKSYVYKLTALRNLNINLSQCYLLNTYYYVGSEERVASYKRKRDYVITQLYSTPSVTIEGIQTINKIRGNNCAKSLFWVVQLKNCQTHNDGFNYTDSYCHEYCSLIQQQRQQGIYSNVDNAAVIIGKPLGNSLVLDQQLDFNGTIIAPEMHANFYTDDYVVSFLNASLPIGINCFTFAIHPNNLQNSGTCNLSMVGEPEVAMHIANLVNSNNVAEFRAYCLAVNILRIQSGFAVPLFTR